MCPVNSNFIIPKKQSMRLISFLFLLSLISCNNDSSNVGTQNSELPEKTSIADIEIGIRDYISRETEQNSGFFPLPNDSSTMKLKLVRVHTEYLSNLGPDSHFACVDLADEKGDVYDVDFFLTGKPGNMHVTEMTLHKENGKPFYNWKQLADKTWKRVDVESSDNRLMGVVEGEDRFRFRYEVEIPEIEESAEIWIPVPTSNPWQDVTLLSQSSENRGTLKQESEYGNQYYYLQLDEKDSNIPLIFEYEVARMEKNPYANNDEDLSRYLTTSELMPVGGRFESIVNEILKGKRKDSDLMKARAIYDYVADTLRYRKAGEYGTGDANYACDSRSGNCTEFHSYFISLARSANIPARFAIGAAIPAERNEGGVNGYHCWAEFYAEGKWWPVDISEGNKYAALSTYYFGHHPANRLEFSKGRDLILDPMPETGKVPFFAYPVFEQKNKPSRVKTKFSFVREGKMDS